MKDDEDMICICTGSPKGMQLLCMMLIAPVNRSSNSGCLRSTMAPQLTGTFKRGDWEAGTNT